MGGEPEPWEGNPGVLIETSAETMLRPFGVSCFWVGDILGEKE